MLRFDRDEFVIFEIEILAIAVAVGKRRITYGPTYVLSGRETLFLLAHANKSVSAQRTRNFVSLTSELSIIRNDNKILTQINQRVLFYCCRALDCKIHQLQISS